MIEIDLIRHGRVDAPAALYGVTDVKVSADENQNIATSLSLLAYRSCNSSAALGYDAVYSSPLIRCLELAQLIGLQNQLSVQQVSGLKEINFGIFDGVPFDKLADVDLSPFQQVKQQTPWSILETFWQAPAKVNLPLAEPLIDFNIRVSQAWHQIVQQAMQDFLACTTDKQKIAVVCHGGVIRMILAHILQLDWRNSALYSTLNIANGSLTKIVIQTINSANNLSDSSVATPIHYQVKQIATPLTL